MQTIDVEISWEAWQVTNLQFCFHLLLPCCLTLGKHFTFGAPHLWNYRRESLAFLCKGLHWSPHPALGITQGALSGTHQAAGRVAAVKWKTHRQFSPNTFRRCRKPEEKKQLLDLEHYLVHLSAQFWPNCAWFRLINIQKPLHLMKSINSFIPH